MFHIYHNRFKTSYALRWINNSAEINHNLFDFAVNQDSDNLISSFGDEHTLGPVDIHDNLINNPRRSIFWANSPCNRFRFYNNHVKSNGENHQNGFFGFHPNTDFDTTRIRDNIAENTAANPRPLMRNDASYQATVQNNQLVNIFYAGRFTNAPTEVPQGHRESFQFSVGVNNAH